MVRSELGQLGVKKRGPIREIGMMGSTGSTMGGEGQ